jgi:multisubunit Na+/H+ antiporter MnhC subunit
MIFFGLAFGYWWKSAIVSGALLWPVILIVASMAGRADTVDGAVLLTAVVLGAANTAAGVVVHQAILRVIRLIRRKRSTQSSPAQQP